MANIAKFTAFKIILEGLETQLSEWLAADISFGSDFYPAIW
jgi:hypothetical protein